MKKSAFALPLIAFLALPAAPVSAGLFVSEQTQEAQARYLVSKYGRGQGTARNRAKLRKLLRPHYYDLQTITPGIREAAGNRSMPVIDHRQQPGELYQCTYHTFSGDRLGLYCD